VSGDHASFHSYKTFKTMFHCNGAQPAAFDNEICGRPHVI